MKYVEEARHKQPKTKTQLMDAIICGIFLPTRSVKYGTATHGIPQQKGMASENMYIYITASSLSSITVKENLVLRHYVFSEADIKCSNHISLSPKDLHGDWSWAAWIQRLDQVHVSPGEDQPTEYLPIHPSFENVSAMASAIGSPRNASHPLLFYDI